MTPAEKATLRALRVLLRIAERQLLERHSERGVTGPERRILEEEAIEIREALQGISVIERQHRNELESEKSDR